MHLQNNFRTAERSRRLAEKFVLRLRPHLHIQNFCMAHWRNHLGQHWYFPTMSWGGRFGGGKGHAPSRPDASSGWQRLRHGEPPPAGAETCEYLGTMYFRTPAQGWMPPPTMPPPPQFTRPGGDRDTAARNLFGGPTHGGAPSHGARWHQPAPGGAPPAYHTPGYAGGGVPGFHHDPSVNPGYE